MMGTRELLNVIRYPMLQALRRKVLINFVRLTNIVTIGHFLVVLWQLRWLLECLEILLAMEVLRIRDFGIVCAGKFSGNRSISL
jgi:hypothetical protein